MIAVVKKAAWVLTRAAALFLVAMMAINVIDVGLRSTINAPIFGTYEIVELMLAGVAFLAIPDTFLRDEHVSIELIDQILPPRAIRALRLIGLGATVVFFGLVSYFMIEPAADHIRYYDVTLDLHMPLIWRASIVVVGIILSFVTVLAIFAREIAAVVGGGGRK